MNTKIACIDERIQRMEDFKQRTKLLALRVIKLFRALPPHGGSTYYRQAITAVCNIGSGKLPGIIASEQLNMLMSEYLEVVKIVNTIRHKMKK